MNQSSKMHSAQRGSSLIEVIVVIGLLTALMGLLLPAVQAARDAAARTDCQNRLHQIGLALHNYEGSHGSFPRPPGYDPSGGKAPTAVEMLNWMPHILPEIEQNSLWAITENACRLESRPFISPPHVGFSTPIKLFICPTDPRLLNPVTPRGSGTIALTSSVALTSYIGSAGSFHGGIPAPSGRVAPFPGVFAGPKGTRVAEISDGTSQTIMVGERPPPDTFQAGQWYQGGWLLETFGGPDGVMYYMGAVIAGDPCGRGGAFGPGRLANPCDRLHYWSLHRGGANFLFCDGSIKFLSYSANSILPSLITRAGGEVQELP